MTSRGTRRKTFEVHVGHLSPAIRKTDLHDLFKTYGDIADIYLNPSNDRPYTFGFVRYTALESAVKACENLNGWPVAGFKIKVELSTETAGRAKNKNKPRSQSIEFNWMKLLADEIKSEQECSALLHEVNKADKGPVPCFTWEGKPIQLDLDQLDAAAEKHDFQRSQVKTKQLPQENNVQSSDNFVHEEEESDSEVTKKFAKFSLEERTEKNHLWAFVRPELWDGKEQQNTKHPEQQNTKHPAQRNTKHPEQQNTEQHGGKKHSIHKAQHNSGHHHKKCFGETLGTKYCPEKPSRFSLTEHLNTMGRGKKI